MFKLTDALRAYAEQTLGVKKGSGDAAYKAAFVLALTGGTLSAGDYAKMAGSKAAGPKNSDGTTAKPKKKAAPTEDVAAVAAKAARLAVKKMLGSAGLGGSVPTPEQVYGKASQVRVKSAAEQYDTAASNVLYPTKSRASGEAHPLAGRQAAFAGEPLKTTSELAKAVGGAWVKWCVHHKYGASNLPYNMRLTDHDKDLFMYAAKNMTWSGHLNANGDDSETPGIKVYRQKLTDFHVKALLDDTASGGIEATPTVFDDAIVMFPVLNGELFPFVNVVNIAKGRRIKGASMQNPTFTSGTAEGNAITPFATSSFIGSFDTPVHVATGAMEIGLDFEEDSPVDFGGAVIEKYGEKALEWLDRVVAVGNGYNEPLGILNTTGLVAIGTDFGAAGPPTVSDYEGLYFGLSKQYRNEAGAVTAYFGNDTSYRRAMSIAVGPGDERRVFGMEHDAYKILNRPFKVQNDIANNKVAFANLKRYRMYRRLGLTVRVETAGRALALSNTKLLVLRMRYGGQMETANAVAVNTDSQS